MNRLCRPASGTVLLVLVLIVSAGAGTAQRDPIDPELIVAAETGLVGDNGSLSILEAMAEGGLVGLSIAVIEDYRIAWARTYGVKEKGGDDAIDRETAFSAASMSKAVTGTLAAILAEKGKIELDVPVGDYLERWQLPENEHTEAVAITLRHLLSHTAGTTQHGFDDHYLGDEIPTLAQVLDGESPATTQPLQIDLRPGTEWRYSGGGFVIAQMAIEDHLGRSLADLAAEHLFAPLGMTHTTMSQPGEEGFPTNAAKAHDETGRVIQTGLPICPQLAPSGMWSTPSDLAVFLIEVQNALRGHETKVISPAVAKLVTTEIAGSFGLGFALVARIHGDWQSGWFGHGGANTGTGGDMAASLEGGRGFIFFGNGPNDIRMPLFERLTDSIVIAHDWKVGK